MCVPSRDREGAEQDSYTTADGGGLRPHCKLKIVPSMITEVSTATFDQLELDCGVTLAPVEVAYETYGTLNAAKSNAILIEHAFSGDAHAAGEGGWWSNMIGPSKGFDTDQCFVICANVLGGCRGTTGPSSINPETGCPW